MTSAKASREARELAKRIDPATDDHELRLLRRVLMAGGSLVSFGRLPPSALARQVKHGHLTYDPVTGVVEVTRAGRLWVDRACRVPA